MNYRTLGATGIDLSEIGLGTWPIGGSIVLAGVPTGYGVVPTEAVRAIGRALDLGVNFFDSADTYGLGRAERVLGEAIRGRRGQVVVATKAGWVPDGTERWVKDVSADHLRASANATANGSAWTLSTCSCFTPFPRPAAKPTKLSTRSTN